jgi:hypothetical protein
VRGRLSIVIEGGKRYMLELDRLPLQIKYILI